MDFHGGSFLGPLYVERVSTLPTWKLEYEGRIVYNKQDSFLYFATNSAWVKSNYFSASGLNADLLDGYHASELAQTHNHTQIINNNDSFYVGTDSFTWAINSSGLMTFNINGLRPVVNDSLDIGSAALKFNEVFATTFNGTATKALYADLAEAYASDAEYEFGTVVGVSADENFDVTICLEELSMNVVGIVSEKPSYLMNSGLENGLPVGLVGLLDVKVSGIVNKGDILVTDGLGGLRAAKNPGEKLLKVAIANQSNKNGETIIKCIKA